MPRARTSPLHCALGLQAHALDARPTATDLLQPQQQNAHCSKHARQPPACQTTVGTHHTAGLLAIAHTPLHSLSALCIALLPNTPGRPTPAPHTPVTATARCPIKSPSAQHAWQSRSAARPRPSHAASTLQHCPARAPVLSA